MEQVGEWRIIEADEPEEGAAAKPTPVAKKTLDPRLVVGVVAAVVLVVAGVAIWATLPQGGMKFDLASGSGVSAGRDGRRGVCDADLLAAALVIDVEGAVAIQAFIR